MASNPANQSLEDQFLRWRKDMETKHEEQARHMAELQSRADHLQQENDRLQARLEGNHIENALGSSHLSSPVKQNKGKEPIRPDDSDAAANDELSSGSSPFPDLPPQRTMWRPNQGRGPHTVPTDPSAGCLAEYEENSAERGNNRSTPIKIYTRGRGVQHRHFRMGIPPLELHQPRICLHPLLFGD